MEGWLAVELAATDAWAAEGVVPADAAAACRERAAFEVEAVAERERTTNHDVAAFIDVVAASIGEEGRWIHYGLTSSDVLDTALALQVKAAGEILVSGARGYRDALRDRALEHAETVCVGRTHGVHAEPTTFGLRLAGFAFEADRNLRRLSEAVSQAVVGAVSGAVGTYASVPPAVERRICETLGIRSEDASTQVVPRDRHAQLLSAVALAGAGLERFATEVRNLQRTEIREVEEPFGKGQKGSSAMPHKRNPITSERITGLARVLRGYSQVGLGERRPLARARHLALGRRAGGAAGRDDRARLHAAPCDPGGDGDDRPHGADAAEPGPHPRRDLQPAGADGAGRRGNEPRRGLRARAEGGAGRVGHGHPVPGTSG